MPHPGAHLDPYTRLRDLVQRGGEGEVWRGDDLRLNRTVAIKLLPASDPWGDDDATAQELRAWREARAVARLLHPAIAAVYHVGMWRDRPYIVLEWVEGATLRARLQRSRIEPRLAGVWLRAIGHAVQHAHDHGVIHCDLKPENILVRPAAAGTSPIKLVDFGLARGDGLIHRSALQVRGTKGYLPPEATTNPPSAVGDQYALAVIAVELISGRRPDLDGAGILHLPVTPAILGASIRRVLHRGLAPNPADRFPDVASFVDAVSAELPSEPPTARRSRRAYGAAPEALSSRHASADSSPYGKTSNPPRIMTGDQLSAIPAAQADLLVLALHGVSLSDDQLDRCLGGPGLQAAQRRLVASGVLHDGGNELRPLLPSLAVDASARLDPRLLASAHAAVATGFERGDLSLNWVAEEAAAAWLRAGRPLDAARCLNELARHSRRILDRCALLERVATLRSAAPSAAVHAEALLDWGLAAASCGLRHDAQRALAAALGSLQIAQQPLGGAGWSLRAWVRELRGDTESAVEAWERAVAEEQPITGYARACIGHARALLRWGKSALVAAQIAQQAAAASDLAELQIDADLTVGIALERAGKPSHGLRVLRTTAFDALCLGIPLRVAVTSISLAEALRRTRRPERAALHLEEAEEALRGQGLVAPAVSLALLQGRVALDEGIPWEAWAGAQRAIALAEVLGLRPQELVGWELARASAETAGLPREARSAAHALAELHRRNEPSLPSPHRLSRHRR